MSTAWIVVTEEKQAAALMAAVSGLEPVAALAIGSKAVAEAAAASGATSVKWINAAENVPVEAYAGAAAELVASDASKAVVTASSNGARAIAGAIAARLKAALLPNALTVSAGGDGVQVDCSDLGDRVVETFTSAGPVVATYSGDSVEASATGSAAIEEVTVGDAADLKVESLAEAEGADAGITKAKIVVSVGRGLKKKEDLSIIEGLAGALGAEIGCSMPVADDLGWVEQSHYVGRSGQHITPQLYVAVGIHGAPQHLEGIKGTKVVVGINKDPDAPIFKAADYGIVGDLYEVVPALQAALGK